MSEGVEPSGERPNEKSNTGEGVEPSGERPHEKSNTGEGVEPAVGKGEPGITQTPLLRVVKGNPTPEEVAALVAVVSASASAPAKPAQRPVPEWNRPDRQVRPSYSHGPGAWRTSGLPVNRGRG